MQPEIEDSLPAYAYAAAQVREMDRAAIDVHSIPGYELMGRAGRASLVEVLARWPAARRITVYCGAGNNAGDGYVLARLARAQGLAVTVIAVAPPEQLKGDAAQAWEDYRSAGGTVQALGDPGPEVDVVVDAVLGIGLDRPLAGDFAAAVAQINQRAVPVLALDIPTGLDADTGRVWGAAVQATATLSFVALKAGLYLGEAPDYCGVRCFNGLDIPDAARQSQVPVLERLKPERLTDWLPPRARTAHKGDAGRVLLVGGSPGMSGAIRLAAEAALRAGAGLVSVATHPACTAVVAGHRPEIMCHAVGSAADLLPLLAAARAVVLGPGLGQSAWAEALWGAAVRFDRPLVLDADGLNLLARHGCERASWVLTPHPGEASRLLGLEAGTIQADRRAAAVELARRQGAEVVLKGACTLVASGDPARPTVVCDRGNPGMASGGTGDVLAGIIGGLLAQGLEPRDAAQAGVLVHALAGDQAARAGERGMLASDLIEAVRAWVNPVTSSRPKTR
jgi:hydroxyethylthiazole kinase-like uncharacterized protein yjeF